MFLQNLFVPPPLFNISLSGIFLQKVPRKPICQDFILIEEPYCYAIFATQMCFWTQRYICKTNVFLQHKDIFVSLDILLLLSATIIWKLTITSKIAKSFDLGRMKEMKKKWWKDKSVMKDYEKGKWWSKKYLDDKVMIWESESMLPGCNKQCNPFNTRIYLQHKTNSNTRKPICQDFILKDEHSLPYLQHKYIFAKLNFPPNASELEITKIVTPKPNL